jgi:hypothetical protein
MSNSAIALGALLFLSAAGTFAALDSQPVRERYLAEAQVTTTTKLPISRDFQGLSHEWGVAERIMGSSTSTHSVNHAYRQLLSNLTAYGSGPIMIRVGGSSTDGIRTVNADTITPFAELAQANGCRFALGVNYGKDDLELAKRQSLDYVKYMPPGSLEAIEIGNEPENYSGDGHRSTQYTFAAYVNSITTWTRELSALLPAGVTIMGPAWGRLWMLNDLPSYEVKERPFVKLISHHFYAGTRCGDKKNPPDFLLQPDSSTAGAFAMAPFVDVTHRNGLRFRVGELNSISCAGEAGLSDTFSASLWAIDAMFEFARIGVDGVNWHTGAGTPYDAFIFEAIHNASQTTHRLKSVRPLYYAMLFFQRATANHSSLIPIETRTHGNVKVWGTLDDSGTIRITIINKEDTPGLIAIGLSGYGRGAVARLTAPSDRSTEGITLAGQTFDSSVDGRPVGAEVIEQINCKASKYEINVPAFSAAIVTVSR